MRFAVRPNWDTVIPAQAGSQGPKMPWLPWVPAFAGTTRVGT
jgi:hypothetical protein